MMQTTAVVVGAGHAGLAMSRRLSERSLDHVVLERGQVADSWRTQRWPSLRLLTPNWQTRLPGHRYTGDDPDGFMPAAGVVATLTEYARRIGAPVRISTTVHTVRAAPEGFEIQANGDVLHAQAVVLATGACTLPAIPRVADAVPPSITTLTPLSYRDPGQLPDGGVLVVGASATGVQLAAEIHRPHPPRRRHRHRSPRTLPARHAGAPHPRLHLHPRRRSRLRRAGRPPSLLPQQPAPMTSRPGGDRGPAISAARWHRRNN